MPAARRLPSATWLLTFEAVARHRSFSAAALALGTSQPAVSQRIGLLEAEVGAALFRRTPRGVAMTEEGERLLRGVAAGFEVIEATLGEVRAMGRGRALTIITDYGFAAFWLLPRLGSLRAEHPTLDVRVLTTQAALDPRREPADLAVAFGGGVWPGCDAELLFPEIVLPVCSPSLLAGLDAPPSGADEIAALPLIHLEAPAGGRWLDWAGWLRASGVGSEPPRAGLSLDNYILVVQAALAGQGVALGWRPLVDQLLSSGQLVPLRFRPVTSPNGYCLVRRRGHHPGSGMALFEGWLRRQLEPSDSADLGSRTR